ncbi:putative efflux protein, MATE family [Ruminococcaceae bacterium YRB3002]|nr:putative efflux protein, MATE family [Ruminococcaceae bacterium YRB3002]
MSEAIHENKMGTMPVKRLIVSMSLPMMISMLVQALYNVADSFFVAKISEDALTAVTLAFPIQNLMIAVGAGTGVGINALLSQSLGERNQKDADKAANTGLLLMVFNFILFLLIGLFVTVPFVNSQTDNATIAGYATSYIRIVTMVSAGLFFQITFERLLQSTGRTVLSMASQITGAVINIILDPIMIFGLFGMPKMGVTGAAVATCIGQSIAAVLGLFLNLKFNKEINLSMAQILKPEARIVKKIYFVGVPSILMVSIGSVMTYLMNILLGGFSSTAQAVFGAYFKLQSFFFMPVFGLNNGLIPVLAYNYGARKKARINEALRFAVVLAVIIMCIGALVLEVIPAQLLLIFDASEKMLDIGIPALRIIGIHLPLAAVAITLGSVFQAFSKSYYSLIVSLGRQLVILIPVAWLLSLTGVLNNVWWCFPLAEIMSLILTVVFFVRVRKTVIAAL